MLNFLLGILFLYLLMCLAFIKRQRQPEKVKCIQCQKITTVEDIHHWEDCPTHPAHKAVAAKETEIITKVLCDIACVASRYQRWHTVQGALAEVSQLVVKEKDTTNGL